MIRRNENAGLIHGCTVARAAPKISHLLFANDCYLFFKATATEANVMKKILDRYESVSGQVVNFNKSLVTFSPNMSEENRRGVCNELGVKEANAPGRYLGVSMRIGRNKTAEFGFLIDRVEQKLQGWNNHTISKPGKVTLLKLVAQSIPNFWMNLMLIPNEVCEKIERKMNSFWWGNGSTNGGIRWMSWDRLYMVKEDGGLGFKRLREFNIAMLAKQAWRLINNVNPLVTKIMQARYYPNSDFLNANLGNNPSYVWCSIFETQAIIKHGSRRRIGNGEDTRIWQVPWLPCLENGYLTTEMSKELENVMVHNFLDESHRQWDEEILADLCNERDRKLIQQIPIPIRNKKDTWYWILDDKGEFSMKSCYRHLRGEEACVHKTFWKKVWGLQLPGKVTNFLWRVCRDVLPTAEVLRCKRVNVAEMCTWCHICTENSVHILFECCFTREIWEEIGLQDLVRVTENDTTMDVLKRAFTSGTKDQCIMV